ncbi:MAG: MmpS family transport accessory protein [Mucilaginibacter sp.]
MKTILAFALLLSVTVFSCKKSDSTHTVKYSVQGTSKSNITYVDGNGNTQTVTNADANWTTSFTSNRRGLLLRLTVISLDSSPIGGKIYIDGQQDAQNNGTSGSVNITASLP